jgi:hypothetical protein
MGWKCSANGEKRSAYRLFVAKPQRRKPLRRSKLK